MPGSVFYASSVVRIVERTLARNVSLPDLQEIGRIFTQWKSSPALLAGKQVLVARPTRMFARRAYSSPGRSGVCDDTCLVSKRIAHGMDRQKRLPLLPKMESAY